MLLHGTCWRPPTDRTPLTLRFRFLLITRMPKFAFTTKLWIFKRRQEHVTMSRDTSSPLFLRSQCKWGGNELFCKGRTHPAWLLAFSSPRIPLSRDGDRHFGSVSQPPLSHTWILGQGESLSGGVCLSLLTRGDVQMTISRRGTVQCEWLNTHTLSQRCAIYGKDCD